MRNTISVNNACSAVGSLLNKPLKKKLKSAIICYLLTITILHNTKD